MSYDKKLKRTVESQYGCTATFLETVDVKETFQDNKTWEGVVSVFRVNGNPKAKYAYAWASAIEGCDTQRFFALLHVQPIASPIDAVRAAFGRLPGLDFKKSTHGPAASSQDPNKASVSYVSSKGSGPRGW